MIDPINDTDLIPAGIRDQGTGNREQGAAAVPAVCSRETLRIAPCPHCGEEHDVAFEPFRFDVRCNRCTKYFHVHPVPPPAGAVAPVSNRCSPAGLPLRRQGRRDGKGEGSPAAEPPVATVPGIHEIEFLLERAGRDLSAAVTMLSTTVAPRPSRPCWNASINLRSLAERLMQVCHQRTELPLVLKGPIEHLFRAGHAENTESGIPVSVSAPSAPLRATPTEAHR